MSEAEQDRALLAIANERGMLGLELGGSPLEFADALERAFRHEWIRLIDISPLAAVPNGRLYRVFMITEKGRQRMRELGS